MLNEDEDDLDYLEGDRNITSLHDVPSDLQDQLDKVDLGKYHQHSPHLAITNWFVTRRGTEAFGPSRDANPI